MGTHIPSPPLLPLLLPRFDVRSVDTSNLIMEALLHQSKGVCPFLKKTSPATLRSLSSSTRQSPGGGTITNLQHIARRCPVMNKALAVQSARISSRNYGKVATGSSGTVKNLLNKKLHTSAEKKASVAANVIRGAPAVPPSVAKQHV